MNREQIEQLGDEDLYGLAVDRGNVYAQHCLGSRLQPVILRAARQWVDTTSLAEEVCAEVLRKLMMPQSERAVVSLRALAHTATRNAAYTLLDRRRRERLRVEAMRETYPEAEPDRIPSPDDLAGLERNTLEARLRTCIQQLRADQREAVERFYFRDLSYAQIAEELQLSPKQVRSHLQNGRKRLRYLMEVL